MKTAVLLDVSAIMYRAFYANINFKTKREATGAVYGFTNTLLAILNEFNPDYIGAAFDVSRSSLKRSELFSDYKAQRSAAPEDLIAQIPRIEELLDGFGITKFKIDGFEADDVLGTLAKFLSREGVTVFIITGDKDLAQLVDENINIALLGKGDGGGFKILSTDEDVKAHLGVTPNLIPDLFGLIGDSSDGIPGVRKIGEKKAVPMLERFGSLEGIYENVDKLTELPGIGKSLVTNIVEDKEIAFLSKKLAQIETEIPLELSVEALTFGQENEKLLKLFHALEFRSFIKKLNLDQVVTPTNPQLDLFSQIFTEPVSTDRPFTLINNFENLETFLELSYTEGNSFLYPTEEGIAFSTEKKDWYLPFNSLNEEMDTKLRNFFLADSVEFYSYNFKTLLVKGYEIKNLTFDTMLAFHLITSQTKEEIESMVMYMLNEDLKRYSEQFGKVLPNSLDSTEYGTFLCKRSLAIKNCYKDLKTQLEKDFLWYSFSEIEMPLIQILADMERVGIKIDIPYFKNYAIELEQKIEELKETIFELAGEEFNLNSPKQLAEILFFKLNLTPVKKNKTGLSTSVEVLESLQEQGVEIAKHILEFRKLSKLKTTYVDPLPQMVDSSDRVHTTFNQTGTVTGRLSSSNPNLQNIPAKTDEGIKIREGFVAKEGAVLLSIDYSQIELRVLTQFTGEPALIAAYENDKDLHDLTARKIFQLSEEEEANREQRSVAKIVNFSILYGKTAFGLSQDLKISTREATEYMNRYFEQYPHIKEFETETLQFAQEHGYVETYFKRRRFIEGINSRNNLLKKQAERTVVNSIIQGTAAEIIKKAMIDIHKFIKDKNDITLLLQVHDELIFEIEETKLQEYAPVIEKIMENCVDFNLVNLKVNASSGKNWADTK
jgi:DNA polymerase-1